MNTEISIVFSTITIGAAVLLFAAGPVAATHQAWACGFGGWGGGWRPYSYDGWGGYSNSGFSGAYGGYPSYGG
jgi:hypothetical protein